MRLTLAVATALFALLVRAHAADLGIDPRRIAGAGAETGYRATSTLAGTRLKTDLKDIGAAASVVTDYVAKGLEFEAALNVTKAWVTTNYDGTPGAVHIPPEKAWFLTSTFQF